MRLVERSAKNFQKVFIITRMKAVVNKSIVSESLRTHRCGNFYQGVSSSGKKAKVLLQLRPLAGNMTKQYFNNIIVNINKTIRILDKKMIVKELIPKSLQMKQRLHNMNMPLLGRSKVMRVSRGSILLLRRMIT